MARRARTGTHRTRQAAIAKRLTTDPSYVPTPAEVSTLITIDPTKPIAIVREFYLPEKA